MQFVSTSRFPYKHVSSMFFLKNPLNDVKAAALKYIL